MDNKPTLQSFISEVCSQIVKGVLDAQSDDEISKYIGVSGDLNFATDKEFSHVTEVAFDIAVTAENDVSGDGKLGVRVANIEGSIASKNTAINKIAFTVPVGIPLPEAIKSEHKRIRDRNNRSMDSRNVDWKTV